MSDVNTQLVICPYCKLENQGPLVAVGTCCWCGWKSAYEGKQVPTLVKVKRERAYLQIKLNETCEELVKAKQRLEVIDGCCR